MGKGTKKKTVWRTFSFENGYTNGTDESNGLTAHHHHNQHHHHQHHQKNGKNSLYAHTKSSIQYIYSTYQTCEIPHKWIREYFFHASIALGVLVSYSNPKNFIFLFCFAFIVFLCSSNNSTFKHLAACIHVIKNTHAYKHMTKLSFPKSNIQIAHIFRLFRASRCNCSTMSRCAIHLMYACIIRFALFKRFRNSIVSHCIRKNKQLNSFFFLFQIKV